MNKVTIFGDGNMGTAIAGVLAAGGASVEHITTENTGAPVTGDIVILAVGYPAVGGIVDAYRDQFAGKVLVDMTNPVNMETFDGLVVPADSSAAAELQAAVPEARVLKAFNTTLASTLAAGTVGSNRTTVLVAGDDADAKAALIGAITAGGAVDAIDAGSLSRAREMEAIGFLQILLAAGEKISWTGGFAVVK